MCGRFALSAQTKDIEKLVNKNPIKLEITPRFNIAPSQNILTISSKDPDNFCLTKWGLIPSWAKDDAIGNSMINARAETIQEKPSFRTPFKKKRCLIFADGYYEWRVVKGEKNKIPCFVHRSDFGLFTFAGLWENWLSPNGNIIESSTIITTSPNNKMSKLHHRIPVVIDPENYDLWLDCKLDRTNEISKLLESPDDEYFDYYEVSKLVNNPMNDFEACKKPA